MKKNKREEKMTGMKSNQEFCGSSGQSAQTFFVYVRVKDAAWSEHTLENKKGGMTDGRGASKYAGMVPVTQKWLRST